jgi:hypothetical protein
MKLNVEQQKIWGQAGISKINGKQYIAATISLISLINIMG